MPKAVWNDTVIADSDETVVVEGNHYFPRDDVDETCLRTSEHHTRCGWKGRASYYHVVVGGEVNENAAWYYPDPEDAAREIEDRIAFWHGIRVK